MNLSLVLRARIIAVLLFGVVWAGAWDIWWHGAVGRDSFWIAPHLMLYASVFGAAALGIFTWWQERGGEEAFIWRRLALSLSVILLAAPLDEIWHQVFGKEVFSTPLIIWSPPHLMIVFGLLASFLTVLPFLLADEEEPKRLFVPMVFGGIYHIFAYFVIPFDPRGSYHIVGFAGAFFAALVLSYSLSFARDKLKGFGVAFLTMVFFLIPLAVRFSDKVAAGTGVLPYERAPAFLELLALFIPAILVDLLWGRYSKLTLGAVAGFFYAAILHGFASGFLPLEYQYGAAEVAVAVAAGTAGGVMGAFLSKLRFM
ncbi:MAG: hypothetical protein V4674_00555 [Patescibacteria group bacterium]